MAQDNQTSTFGDRLFGVSMLVFVVLLMILAGWGTASNLLAEPVRAPGSGSWIEARRADFTMWASNVDPHAVNLLIHVQRLDTRERKIQGNIRVLIGDQLLVKLYDAGGNRYVFSRMSHPPEAEELYRDQEFRFVIVDPASEFAWQEVKIPIGELCCTSASKRLGTARPFGQPMRASPQNYPDDVYTMAVEFVGFGVPFKFGWRDELGTIMEGLPPVNVTVEADPAMVGKKVLFRVYPSLRASYITTLAMYIQRDGPSRAYAYAMAGVPLTLAILLGYIWFTSPRRTFQEMILGVSATLLTVLPLRAVLVPSELTELTRMDYILGIELLLLLSVAVVRYLSNIWSS